MSLTDRKFSSLVEHNKTKSENDINTSYGQVGAGQYNSTAPTLADTDYGHLQLDSEGKLKTTAAISGDVNVDSTSVDTSGLLGKASGTNSDFTTAYSSGTVINLSSLPSQISSVTADDVTTIIQVSGTTGAVLNTYTRDDISLTSSGTVLAVTGATFNANDTFVVYTNIQRDVKLLSHTDSTTSDRTEEIDPVDEHYIEEELIDTTNVAAATNYYPSSTGKALGNFKNMALHFVTSGGVTMTVEAKIDDSTDWADVTPAGYNMVNNNSGSASFVDESGLLRFTDLIARHVRIKSVTSDATNGVQLHWKLTAL